MPETQAPPDLEKLSLADVARLVAERSLPPVEHWDPPHCGHSDMRIARDGTWFHQGSPITRPAMVRLFSNILRREPDGRFVLVTPVEKLDIDVEDTPFLAVALKSEGEGRERRLGFQLNTGDAIVAGVDHSLRFEMRENGPHPYLDVRRGLDARIARPVYYELAELALNEDHDPIGLWSDGAFFVMEAT